MIFIVNIQKYIFNMEKCNVCKQSPTGKRQYNLKKSLEISKSCLGLNPITDSVYPIKFNDHHDK